MSFKYIANTIISDYGKCKSVEKVIYSDYMSICGAMDVEMNDSVIEFKTSERDLSREDALQVYLYSLMCNLTPILINLQTGDMCYLSTEKSTEQWKYLFKCYSTLRTHTDMVTDNKNTHRDRKKYRLDDPIEPNECEFVIDTEFCQSTFFTGPYRKGNRPISAQHIFDIAIINLVDPYRSIIAAVKPMNMDKIGDMSENKKTKMLKENIDKAMLWIN